MSAAPRRATPSPHRGVLARLRAAAGRRADRGSATPFVVGLTVVLFAVAGLVADGGRAINARVAITDDAEQAARVGADQVQDGSLRGSGTPRIDPVAATSAAQQFLAARGYESSRVSISADDERVAVRVSDVVPTGLLQLILIDSFTVEGSATARAAIGIVTELEGGP
ncbi:pilus assembly protein TadG-related protein [Cellulomonas sp. KH9]|uniref:pilus assembly protein TadG-related protein n=1 Tax=Cellulomonas sp. KH9 TaxID=1855324 RepID=UPI0008E52ADE|nr:pilus assembly protein TadG-related protein [Cellulomonas sp. KH9]SFJ61799.1 Putative Flp pilus-assembly TadE/G-like [Cellulomonas sp. KH9]